MAVTYLAIMTYCQLGSSRHDLAEESHDKGCEGVLPSDNMAMDNPLAAFRSSAEESEQKRAKRHSIRIG